MAFLEKSGPSLRGGAKEAFSWLVGSRSREEEDAKASNSQKTDLEYALRDARSDDYRWALTLNACSYEDLVISQFGVWDAEAQEQRFLDKWNYNGGYKIVLHRHMRVGLLHKHVRRDCNWVNDIQIARRWRGRGLAQAIFSDILADAREKNVPVRVRMLQLNICAKIIYDRLGFTPTHEDSEFVYMQSG